MHTRNGVIGLFLSLLVIAALPAFAAENAAAVKPAEKPAENMVVLSPLNYQVFQRQTRLEGRILVSGHVLQACDKVQARITGESLRGKLSGRWQSIPFAPSTEVFACEVPTTAGGWYKVELRGIKGGKVVAQSEVEQVGVGEVFVGSGQSNSTNSGDYRITETSGMVSTFSGSYWRLADDPQPGVHDNTMDGSFWPAFGDAMYERYHVPIGVASTGHGGTSVDQWQPGTELFQWTLTRVNQLGKTGFRALLWHQGENDVRMDPKEYAAKMTNVIQGARAAAGWEFPWFVAQASYLNAAEPTFPGIRSAQQSLWESGVALEGPDTDILLVDCRDENTHGIHLSPKGLHLHGQMWADKVSAYLDSVLK